MECITTGKLRDELFAHCWYHTPLMNTHSTAATLQYMDQDGSKQNTTDIIALAVLYLKKVNFDFYFTHQFSIDQVEKFLMNVSSKTVSY